MGKYKSRCDGAHSAPAPGEVTVTRADREGARGGKNRPAGSAPCRTAAKCTRQHGRRAEKIRVAVCGRPRYQGLRVKNRSGTAVYPSPSPVPKGRAGAFFCARSSAALKGNEKNGTHEDLQHDDKAEGGVHPAQGGGVPDLCLRPDRLQLHPHGQRAAGLRLRHAAPVSRVPRQSGAVCLQYHRHRRQDHQEGERGGDHL